MSRLYADRADTKLATGINASVTSLSVLDGSVFPAPTGSDFAVLTLEEGTTFERVRLTARSGNTLTVTRASDGTSAQSFTTAATVSLRPTASALAGLVEKAGDTMTGPLAITGGTVTASAPLFDGSQTWNAAGVAFTGLRVNVTDTASAAGALLVDVEWLADVERGGTSICRSQAKRDRYRKCGRPFIATTARRNNSLRSRQGRQRLFWEWRK